MSEMPPLPPALAAIRHQDSVKRLLGRAVAEGHVSHAYLFVGAPGSGMEDAALALAGCLVCPDGGDGTCAECRKVRHHTHPDVRWLAPESASGYLIAQIRDLIADVQLMPVRAKTKVCILRKAELLRGASANALLKTLEEPPAQVVFILCATSSEAMLSTIVSRCQVVPFRSIPAATAVETVAEDTGASVSEARIALAVTGTPAEAAAFLADPGRCEVRRLVVDSLRRLRRGDAWDALCAAREIVSAAKEPLKEMKKEQKKERDAAADYLSASALRQLDDAQKREIAAHERSGMMEVFAAAESVLRDALLISQGVRDEAVNGDCADVASALADAGTDRILACFAAVDEGRSSLSRNVSSQLALEVMLCAIKEALT